MQNGGRVAMWLFVCESVTVSSTVKKMQRRRLRGGGRGGWRMMK